MTSPDTFISVDLETTGLDPNLHEIIEIGAIKVKDGKITGEYSELVKPSHPIPEFITHMTGITERDVVGASKIEDIIPSFLNFIKGYRLLGQNVAFDVAFLRKAAGIGNINTAIDNIELARILLPRLTSYSLDSLIDFFAINPEKRHRALDDARTTTDIFLKLIDMLRMVPSSFLNEMIRISTSTGSVLKEIFEAHLLERMSEPLSSPKKALAELPKEKDKSDNIFGDFSRELPPKPESQKSGVDICYIASLLEQGGRLSKKYDAYEERAGQIAFAKKVAGAFNDSEILLVEAGTGTGKSIAYLIPAILWAEAARERVVVSTNTKNLQEQLFFNDIPLLSMVLDFPFRAVILKGRGNYICLNRWQRLVNSMERFLGKQERYLILPVASWLNKTTTGDLSETGFFSMLVESGLLERINSESISCLGARCKLREECFVNRVRKAAQRSHVIIVNHSLVFSDIVSEGGVLGLYSHIVFDEAHNIEKVALRYLGVSMDYFRIRRSLNRLYSRNGRGYGILAMLHGWVQEMTKGWPEFADNVATIESAVDTVQHIRTVTSKLFEYIDSAVRSEALTVKDSPEGKLRYFGKSTIFGLCRDTIDELRESISLLIQVLEDISLLVSGVTLKHLADREEVMIDLEKSIQDFQSVIHDFDFLIEASGLNVFWFEYYIDGNWHLLKIKSAPLDVAEKLAVCLYDHMETVVMTSATLTVARDFSYISKRLGLNIDSRDRVVEFIASSIFDYRRQAKVFMPTFLPSPKSEGFIEETNRALLAVAEKTRRGMLVLFTSRGHLQRSYYDIKDMLMRDGITLMAQGIDGSRNLLLRRFREEKSSVLFGTDSFWEGVDVPGSALELVVIVRLPFAVPTEPVVQAQMEEIKRAGSHPFMEFSVPEAAIRLRQGAGRLIRHRTDRGAIIIMDNRIVTTKYGSIFQRCLPGKAVRAESIEMLVKGLNDWFG